MKLEFREVLRGFVGRAEDPRAGFAAGRREGGAIAFRAVATIEDLARFEADPLHRVALAGELDWAPLGRGLPLRAARIHLFLPRDGGVRFEYELPFEAGGKRHRLVGEKRIPRRPGLRAMTTLYSEVFEEGSAQPMARGILRVPLGEALIFPFTLRVPGGGIGGTLAGALRFIRFSQRQLLTPAT